MNNQWHNFTKVLSQNVYFRRKFFCHKRLESYMVDLSTEQEDNSFNQSGNECEEF